MSRKIILTDQQKSQIKTLFNQGMGVTKIAQELNVGRGIIFSYYKELGLVRKGRNPNPGKPRAGHFFTEKKCISCNTIKNIDQFRITKRKNGRINAASYCRDCERILNYNRNKQIPKSKKKEYRKNRKDKSNEQLRNRRKNDVPFKLRKNISKSIWQAFKNNNSDKNGDSLLNYLPNSIDEIKNHLEKQFEFGMNWNNFGRFDPDRETWQIDHIVPHSLLPYTSMDSEIFRFCWSIYNLRPLSAKKNMEEGSSRIRHKAFIWLLYCLMAQCYLIEQEMHIF